MIKKLPISKSNAEYQILEALKNNRTKRHQCKELFVEGIESIKQAAKAQADFTRFICRDYSKLSNWAKDFLESFEDLKLFEVEDSLYKNLCDKNEPSELLATVKMPEYSLEDLKLRQESVYVICDRPSDLGNFGSLLRSADAFGIEALLVLGHSIDVFDPKVIRSSLGALFHVKIVHLESFSSLENWLKAKKSQGLRVYGSDSGGESGLDRILLQRPLALVLGNESKGMSLALKDQCSQILSIPQIGNVNSLNLACAASILLWEVFKTPV